MLKFVSTVKISYSEMQLCPNINKLFRSLVITSNNSISSFMMIYAVFQTFRYSFYKTFASISMIQSTDKYMYFKVKDMPMSHIIFLCVAWAVQWWWLYGYRVWNDPRLSFFSFGLMTVFLHKTTKMHMWLWLAWRLHC